MCRFLSPVTKHVFGLSEECGYIILLGFLCGYPIGSKLSADLVKKNEISVREGQILISFCNNVSPAFMITFLIGGIIGIPAFSSVLLAVMLGVPLFLGIVFSRVSLYLEQKKNIFNDVPFLPPLNHLLCVRTIGGSGGYFFFPLKIV